MGWLALDCIIVGFSICHFLGVLGWVSKMDVNYRDSIHERQFINGDALQPCEELIDIPSEEDNHNMDLGVT